MQFVAGPPPEYLGQDQTINWSDDGILALAAGLTGAFSNDEDYAAAAYTWVRDEVSHSVDAQDPRVSISASDALVNRVGLCHAKSHLLVALLRARGIPAGLCYQRLSDGDGSFALHGLVAVWLGDAWHRIDPRGNKEGVDAQFSLGIEQLAWSVDPRAGEVDYPEIRADAHPGVVSSLRGTDDVLAVRLPAEA